MPKIKMPARSYYDRTHDVKGDISMGLMYPVLHEEIMPGDTFSLQDELLIRMAPMIRPVMHEMTAYLRFFFVRDWTIMDGFEEMISAGPDGQSDIIVPMNPDNYTVEVGSVWDWLNVNPGVYDAGMFSMLPQRAYNKVYNDWYRPQNQVPDEVDLDDNTMKRTTWELDYFTSALPFTQRGPQVVMPLGTTAPVTITVPDNAYPTFGTQGNRENPGRGLVASTNQAGTSVLINNTGGTASGILYWQNPNLSGYADLSQVSGIPINDWRNYLQVQSWMELNALGGVRYPELVLAHFGVVTPDSRVERAEYLGSMKVPVVVSEVLQTSQSTEQSPQANMAGHAIGANRRQLFKRSFTEHGWLIGILTFVPKSGYQQGIPAEYQRQSALDFPWPLFMRLGMRDIPIKTLYTGAYLDHDGNLTTPENGTWTPVDNPDETFAYNTIYDELRYKSNTVHGKFRTDLSFWHLNRLFNKKPVFNKNFVECIPNTDRIKEVTTESDAFVQILHRLKCYRELPKAPTPWHF